MKMIRFLKSNDCQTILAHAARQVYQPDEVLLEEGSDDKRLFFIKKGRVRVQHRTVERGVELAYMHAGDIFGEMSFIDGEWPSASVIACNSVDALSLSHRDISAIVRKDPAFYGRFYKSLADILTQRLCEATRHATTAPTWDKQVPTRQQLAG